jgi:hypothetical protein
MEQSARAFRLWRTILRGRSADRRGKIGRIEIILAGNPNQGE